MISRKHTRNITIFIYLDKCMKNSIERSKIISDNYTVTQRTTPMYSITCICNILFLDIFIH